MVMRYATGIRIASFPPDHVWSLPSPIAGSGPYTVVKSFFFFLPSKTRLKKGAEVFLELNIEDSDIGGRLGLEIFRHMDADGVNCLCGYGITDHADNAIAPAFFADVHSP